MSTRLPAASRGMPPGMSKLMVAGVFATCYVLGARAGRERYDQIRKAIARFMADPRVKEIVINVEEKAMNWYNDVPPSGDGDSPANRAEYT